MNEERREFLRFQLLTKCNAAPAARTKRAAPAPLQQGKPPRRFKNRNRDGAPRKPRSLEALITKIENEVSQRSLLLCPSLLLTL